MSVRTRSATPLGPIMVETAQSGASTVWLRRAIVETTEQGVPVYLAGDDASAERWPWINRTKPRLVPDELMQLKLNELGVPGNPLQNGHVRLSFDQFTAGVRALARLATE